MRLALVVVREDALLMQLQLHKARADRAVGARDRHPQVVEQLLVDQGDALWVEQRGLREQEVLGPAADPARPQDVDDARLGSNSVGEVGGVVIFGLLDDPHWVFGGSERELHLLRLRRLGHPPRERPQRPLEDLVHAPRALLRRHVLLSHVDLVGAPRNLVVQLAHPS
eukprot:scaffold27464_cov64-Phaeocystis_antarctica.AAC.2